MSTDPNATTAAIHRGLTVSIVSLLWTVLSGSAAVAIGVVGHSVSLAVFGAIGLLDAAGSASLIVHFRHSLHHEAVSARLEQITLRIVRVGMAVVGVATIAESVQRLVDHAGSTPLVAGMALTAVAVVILATLAAGKQRIAPLIPSPALRADGWLSAVGAVLAAVTLLGTGLERAFSWWWSDSAAAIAVAVAAIGLSITLRRS